MLTEFHRRCHGDARSLHEPGPLRHGRCLEWWQSALGRSLLAAESELLGEALEDVFGWELLQVGAWGEGREMLARSRTRRQTIVAGSPEQFAAYIKSEQPRWSKAIEASGAHVE